MTDWLILTESRKDIDHTDTPHKVLSVRDYLSAAGLFDGLRPVVINLARSYAYQSAGYYASLLAEARGHRVIPTVQTMLELSRKGLYASALPELEEAINRDRNRKTEPEQESFTLLVAFGRPSVAGYEKFARLLFDWFRCPMIAVEVDTGEWTRIKSLKPVSPKGLTTEDREFFTQAMAAHCRRSWSGPKSKTPLRWSLAVLHNPKEAMPPTQISSLKRLASVGAKMGIEVEPIQQKDLPRVAEFDALFIRETTSVNDHTFRFARRAEQEGMPVIDDTMSMIRCTNKVYLKEMMEAAKLPIPKSIVMASAGGLTKAAETIGFPMVVKIPDGSFSRGVHKVNDLDALTSLCTDLFHKTDLLLAQEFMPTDFDWRVGVLGGKPLYVSQYLMARKHWQIVHHKADGKFDEGGFKTMPVEQAPAEVVDVAVKAAAMMGDGLYGVDLKQNADGVFVIEVNDNPNLDTNIEGAALGDELWRRLLGWFLERLEAK
ncbi:MAG: RimK family protein [Nisaea sp.]|uniref:RimK family protein n=1 Tax=Nisaea sp. TaxID=2024842 RepID=UPI001B243928|nr:RimK family protein [Nisaea sp.]MBO6560968.1 RimK family protein [Nisaea sp.]